MTLTRVPPLGLAVLAFGIQLAAGPARRPTRASNALAAGMGVTSTLLLVGSVAEFRNRKTTVNPVSPGAAELVTSGPNRLTRNPMYVGMAGLLAAHAVARRSLRCLVPAALFVVVIDREQIPAEEAVLRDRFGDAFGAYASSTPRWVWHAVR